MAASLMAENAEGFSVRLAEARDLLPIGKDRPLRAEQALADIDDVEKGLNGPTLIVGVTWPYATNEAVLRTHRLMTSRLRAQAAKRLGQLDAASESLAARKDLLEAGLKTTDARAEYVRMLTLVEAQIAANAFAPATTRRRRPRSRARLTIALRGHLRAVVRDLSDLNGPDRSAVSGSWHRPSSGRGWHRGP